MTEQEVTPVALLLQQGQSWEREGKVFQAIGAYLRVPACHSVSPEAQTARGSLFDLAQRFEVEGKVHQAVHLYQRLAGLR